MRVLSNIKCLFVSPEARPRTIQGGPFKGITMELSLQNQTQIYLGLFEKETHPWLARLSEGVTTAVDIGAAHGEYALYFLMKTMATKVFVFEPCARSLALLDNNLKLNGLNHAERLEISSKFLGDSESEQVTRLDRLATSVSTPCLIKMDVDGAEEQVLRGAKALNRLPGVRWLIETHSKDLEVACRELLTETGFQVCIISNAWWRLFIPEMRPIEHNRWLAAWKNE